MKIINEIKKITKKKLQKSIILILIIQCLFAINIEFNVYAQGTYELIATAPGKDPAQRKKKGSSSSGKRGSSARRQGAGGQLSEYSGERAYNGPVQDYKTIEGSDVPLISQTGVTYVPYGQGTVQDQGCVAASCAMVLSYLTGEFVPVEEVATRYNTPGKWGSGPDVWERAGADWGFKVEVTSDRERAKKALRDGHPVGVLAQYPRWCNVPHAVVYREMLDDNHTVYINDPASDANSHREWTFDDAGSGWVTYILMGYDG